MAKHARGLYETLITKVLAGSLDQIDSNLVVKRDSLRAAEAGDRIALHLGRVIQRLISSLKEDERVANALRPGRQESTGPRRRRPTFLPSRWTKQMGSFRRRRAIGTMRSAATWSTGRARASPAPIVRRDDATRRTLPLVRPLCCLLASERTIVPSGFWAPPLMSSTSPSSQWRSPGASGICSLLTSLRRLRLQLPDSWHFCKHQPAPVSTAGDARRHYDSGRRSRRRAGQTRRRRQAEAPRPEQGADCRPGASS